MTIKQIKYRFMLMQFLLWFTFGTFGIFYVAYLKDLGYSSKFIALGLTLSTLIGIISQYLFGYISDLTSKIKTIFLALLVAMMCTVALFIFFARYSVLAIGIMILFNITWMPLESLLDSWIFSTKDLPHSGYGTIRSSGSFGFSIITIIFGGLIVRFGFKVSIMAFIISGCLLFITAITTKTKTLKVPSPMGFKQVKQLITNPRYMGLLLFSVLIFIGHMGINNFYIYVVQNVGGNEGLIGMSASAAAFTEILGFYLGSRLQKKHNPLVIMIWVAVASFFRVYFLTQSGSYIGVLITSVLQGFAFSIFLVTFKIYISKVTPLSLLASAQTVGASTYFGIASLFANILGGLLIDDYGINVFYKFITITSAVAVVYIVLLYFIDQRRSE
ncbi:MAG: MFS transporter [Spirochaetaceae bacterium]